jgi:hypothetical protein
MLCYIMERLNSIMREIINNQNKITETHNSYLRNMRTLSTLYNDYIELYANSQNINIRGLTSSRENRYNIGINVDTPSNTPTPSNTSSNTSRTSNTNRNIITRLDYNTTLTDNYFVPINIINQECELINYNSSLETQTECPIDMLPFSDNEEIIRIKYCRHIFRVQNLMLNFRERATCPLCRHNIVTTITY